MVFPSLTAHRDWGLLALRVAVGIIFMVHGWMKVPGLMHLGEANAQGNGGLTLFFGVQGIFEMLGGAALIVGFWAQIVALLFVVIMIGAIAVKNTMMPTGFSSGTTTGWEFDFALLAANFAILLVGPGSFAFPRPRQLPVIEPNQQASA